MLAVAAGGAGVALGLSPTLQIRRMVRCRSSADVSVLYFAVVTGAVAVWLAYGVARRDPALILANAVSVVVNAAAVGTALHYRAPGRGVRRARGGS